MASMPAARSRGKGSGGSSGRGKQLVHSFSLQPFPPQCPDWPGAPPRTFLSVRGSLDLFPGHPSVPGQPEPGIPVDSARVIQLPCQPGCPYKTACVPRLHSPQLAQPKRFHRAFRYIYEASNDLKPSRRKTTFKDTMDNHKVFCGLIIFLQIADLSRGYTYNFSLCNHDEIQEDLLNVLDPHMTFKKEELQLDFHTCEDAPSPPAGPQQSEGSQRAERAGRLLECALTRARGCGDRPPLWPSTLYVVQRHCPGYRLPQGGAVGRAIRGPCDESKARELMAVWRSYMNLG